MVKPLDFMVKLRTFDDQALDFMVKLLDFRWSSR
jgi:hypothetical protein